jgi:hypothetical protein
MTSRENDHLKYVEEPRYTSYVVFSSSLHTARPVSRCVPRCPYARFRLGKRTCPLRSPLVSLQILLPHAYILHIILWAICIHSTSAPSSYSMSKSSSPNSLSMILSYCIFLECFTVFIIPPSSCSLLLRLYTFH